MALINNLQLVNENKLNIGTYKYYWSPEEPPVAPVTSTVSHF